MKKQNGQAMILVLILLGIGSLMMIPVLRYISTGLLGQRSSENALTEYYKAESALDDALWQMKGGLMMTLTQQNPSVAYDFNWGTSKFPMVISVPSVPVNTTNLAVGSMKYLIMNVSPNFLSGNAAGYTTNYSIRVRTQPWSSARSTLEATLPLGMTLVSGSTWTIGPVPQNKFAIDTAVINYTAHTVAGFAMVNNIGLLQQPVVYTDPPPGGYVPGKSYIILTTKPDGRQHIKYSIIPSASGGNMNYVLIFQATGKPAGGISYAYLSANIEGSGVTDAQVAALGVAFYTVTMTVGGVNYKVIIAYDAATNTMKIISYSPV